MSNVSALTIPTPWSKIRPDCKKVEIKADKIDLCPDSPFKFPATVIATCKEKDGGVTKYHMTRDGRWFEGPDLPEQTIRIRFDFESIDEATSLYGDFGYHK